MSERKKIFTNLRDKHGVTDLLREVSQRKSALTPKDRKEVSDIVDRVEENTARRTPFSAFGKLKKNDSNDGRSSNADGSNEITDSEPVPVNKWGKDFFQKFSNKQAPQNLSAENTNDQQQSEQRTPNDFFRKFSVRGIQNPLKNSQQEAYSGEQQDRHTEIKKTFERSQQSGREMFQNLSKNFQNFSNNFKRPLQSTNTAVAAAVSDSLCAPNGANSSSDAASPQGSKVTHNTAVAAAVSDSLRAPIGTKASRDTASPEGSKVAPSVV